VAVVFDDLDVAVHRRYLPFVVNQTFRAVPLFVRLLTRSNIVVRGGFNIRQPIMYGELPGGSFSGMGQFDTSYVQTHAYAEAQWKSNYIDVTIPGTDLAKADSDIEIIGLLNPKMEAASYTIKKKLTEQIYGDGSGNGGQDLDGLKNAIDDGTTFDSYLGISRTTYPWWKSNLDSTGGAFSLDMVQNAYGLATDGDEMPDLIVCNQTIWNKFWSRVQPAQHFISQAHADIAAVGFQGFEFNKAVVVPDNYCPAGVIYLLNTKYIQFVINQNANFIWTPPKTGTAEWAYIRQLIVMCNLIVTAPWRQTCIKNVS